ncbi:MAG: GNAT family N-acetyltransferase [Candidatus Nanopelagicaceae bacterium]|nr:GNAT family N-acetyltransferase [Candidatus Nanopelagicaceae bacterium]
MGRLTSMEFTIRAGTAEDIDAIVRIFRACWTQSYREVLNDEVRNAMTQEKAYELWLPSLDTHFDRETLVACIDDSPIGIARIGSDPDFPTRGHLFSLYVDPESAGKGFGKALLAAALDKLSVRKFNEISLWVFKANPGAIGLYKKLGFEPTGRERTNPRWRSLEIELLRGQVNSQL